MPAKIRNPVARSPLLRKGGVHGKSKKAQRAADRKEVKRLVAEATSLSRFLARYFGPSDIEILSAGC